VIEALVCVQPGELKVEQRQAPKAEPGHVLVRPRRVGICGTDYHIYEGNQPYLNYPRVMGHELAVEVVENNTGTGPAVGSICVVNPYLACGECHACKRGKPNCCMRIQVLGVHRDGGMTGLLSLPPGNLIHAEGLSADECAMVEFLAIGAHAVRRGAVTPEDRVLVIGAGPIGLGAGLFASLSGGAVTVMDRDPERLETVGKLYPIAGTILAEGDVAKTVADATSGVGFDVVFDATGSRRSIEIGFNYIAHGGRYVLVSIVQGDITFTDSDFHRREATLLGSRNALNADFERVIGAIRDGKVKSSAWITHRTSLAGAVTDLPRWAKEKTGLIKALIEIA